MANGSTTTPPTTIGLDLGDRVTEACVLDGPSGRIVERFRVEMHREAVRARFAGRARSRVILEAGGASAWVSRLLSGPMTTRHRSLPTCRGAVLLDGPQADGRGPQRPQPGAPSVVRTKTCETRD